MSVKEGSAQPFNERLEALRGVAALAVAVGHSLLWLKLGDEASIWQVSLWKVHGLQATTARAILAFANGAPAVNIFFVLSGVVLTWSLMRSAITPMAYVRFLIKRAFRILPMLWVSVGLVGLYLWLIYPGYAQFPAAGSWFEAWYAQPVTAQSVLRDVTLQSATLNTVAWTLKVELAAAALIPAALWLFRLGWAPQLLVLGAAIAWAPRAPADALGHYFYMFVAGMLITLHAERLRRFAGGWMAVLGLALIVFTGACTLLHPVGLDLLSTAGSGLLITALIGGVRHAVLAPLDWKAVRWLGQRSYSFYLLHFIVLYGLANAVLHRGPQSLLLRWPLAIELVVSALSLAVAAALAALAFAFVEKPATVLGRNLAAKLSSPSAKIAAPAD